MEPPFSMERIADDAVELVMALRRFNAQLCDIALSVLPTGSRIDDACDVLRRELRDNVWLQDDSVCREVHDTLWVLESASGGDVRNMEQIVYKILARVQYVAMFMTDINVSRFTDFSAYNLEN